MNFTYAVEQEQYQAFIRESIREMSSEQTNTFLRDVALRMQQQLVATTPKDTGRAASGWLGGARAKVIEVAGADWAAKAEGRAKARYTERLKSPKPYVEIFNGVNYVIYLEYGSSLQAPAGFVRLAMRQHMQLFVRDSERATIAALRRANIKSRAMTGLKQGRLTRKTTLGDTQRLTPWQP